MVLTAFASPPCLRSPRIRGCEAQFGLSSPPSDGSLWIGSYDGLQRWNRGQLSIYRATGSSAKQSGDERPSPVNGTVREMATPGLPDNYIGSLFEDRRGRVWVTTRKGVAWFENDKFIRASGLPEGSANAVIADDGDGVWISYPGHGLFHVSHGRVVQSIPWPWSSQGGRPAPFGRRPRFGAR